MGKLIRLEVYNFKSYRGHHVLLFGDAYFTSIIGPNGSGKSNSMDAISFVLGIKSSHLRSSHLRDLIYRGRVLKTSKINADGTATEDGPEGEQNGITNGDANGTNSIPAEHGSGDEGGRTRSQRHDPTSAWVMAVYLDEADEEQKWKRSITSSGSSEYSINGRNVTAKEYNAALEAEDILIKARNFLVFQGDVEAIASQSPKDITRLVEQISGSLEHKSDYDRLSAEAEEATKSSGTKLQQRRAMKQEMNVYRDQKAEADNYAAKVGERDEAIAQHYLWKLYHFQRVIDESNAEIEKCQAELQEHKRGVQKFQEKLEEATRVSAKATKTLGKSEQAIKVKEKDLDAKKTEIEPLEQQIEHTIKGRDTLQERVSTLKKEEAKINERIDKLGKDKAIAEKTLRKSEDEAKALSQKGGRDLTDADLQEYSRLSVEVTKRTSSDANQARDIERDLKTAEEVTRTLESSVENLQTQINNHEEALAKLVEQRSSRSAEAKDYQKALTDKGQALNNLKSDRKRAHDQREELNEKLRKVFEALSEADDGRRESEDQANKRAIVRDMKRNFGDDAVLGRISDLCKPKEKRFESAISTAIGRDLDTVVVDSEKTAKKCLEYLAAQRFGQMKFIPLDKIAITDIDAKLKSLPKVRLVIDAIDYKSAHERAMSYACGNTIICEDLKHARHICFEKRINVRAVTLDGSVINKGGTMAGGAGNDKRGERKFAAAQVDKLRTEQEKLMEQLRNLPDSRGQDSEEQNLNIEIAGIRTRLDAAKEEIRTLDRNIESTKKDLKHAKEELSKAKPQFEKQRGKVKQLREAKDSYTAEIAKVEDEVFADFCKRLNYTNIREYEEQQGSLQQKLNEERNKFTTQIKRLESQIARETEERTSIGDRIKGLERKIQEREDHLQGIRTRKESLENELDALSVELDQLQEDLTAAKEAQQERADAVKRRRAEFAQENKKADDQVRQMNEREQEKRKVSGERYMLLQKCKLDEIKIPLTDDSKPIESLPMGDILQQDEDAMDVDDDVDATILPQADERDYGIEVDFDELEDELKEDDSTERDETLQDVISALNAELDKMQPNMRATERLNGAVQRHDDAEQDYNDARDEARRIMKEFEEVKQQRLAKFNRAFKHISEQIVHVYAELTRSTGSNVVGNAQLTVENDEEPYMEGLKYTAMPPLKRFRDMEHLSGGEKTIAALALLFAVHSYQPSPFFVLDEVDAALDNVNVARVANYVKRHAKPGMQFIVISLKTGFFMESESLVGIMRDQTENSSRAVTLDLRKYLPN